MSTHDQTHKSIKNHTTTINS